MLEPSEMSAHGRGREWPRAKTGRRGYPCVRSRARKSQNRQLKTALKEILSYFSNDREKGAGNIALNVILSLF